MSDDEFTRLLTSDSARDEAIGRLVRRNPMAHFTLRRCLESGLDAAAQYKVLAVVMEAAADVMAESAAELVAKSAAVQVVAVAACPDCPLTKQPKSRSTGEGVN